MDSTLATLFDDDNVENVPRRQKTPHSVDKDTNSPRPTKRRRQTLHGSSDDEVPEVIAPKEVDMRAMEDLDEDTGLDWAGVDRMEAEITAKIKRNAPPPLTPHAIQPSSSPPPDEPDEGDKSEKKGKGGEEKKRRKPVTLNEGLLLGPSGFPRLIEDMKAFKPKGKGHEASDLNRLMHIYQFWTHQLYPKSPFRDTATRIEKLCHSKLLMSSLSRWKDEAKGITTAEDPEDKSDSDEDNDDGDVASRIQPSSDRDTAMSDAASSPRVPSRPPTSASENEFNDADLYDEDLEALLRNEANQASTSASTSNPISNSEVRADDDWLWENFDDPGINNATTLRPPASSKEADDSMDWDVLDEMGDFDTGSSLPTANRNQSQPTPDDDMDDFYV